MKRIELEQGSPEWLEFRRDKIGSSDAATIMGMNPWKTRYQLWKEKIEGTEIPDNPAMAKGRRLEPIARQKFIQTKGIYVEPAIGTTEGCQWRMASFDGLSKDGSVALEIKCGSDELHEKAIFNQIPDYYMCQIQHAYSIARPDKFYYASYEEKKDDLAIIEVVPDWIFIDELIEEEYKFLQLIRTKTAPEMTEKDYELFEHDRGSQLLEEYFTLGEEEKAITKRRKDIKEELIEISPKRNFILDGTKIYQSTRCSYDMDRMKADGIQVDNYKKISEPFWVVAPKGKSLIVGFR